MKFTLAVALSLVMNSTFIVCFPFRGYRNGHQHQRIARTVATHSSITNSDMFFIKRSLSPLENPESSSDANLVARGHEDNPEDCDDEDEDDDDSYDSSSSTVANTTQTSAATDIPKPEAAYAKPAAPTPTYTSTASAPAPTDSSTSTGALVSVGLDISPSSSSSYTSSSSSSYSSETYTGKATFFLQGGVAGSCGTVHPDSAYIVAIDASMYDDGKFCGKSILVTRVSTGKSITCTGADKCPGCPSPGSLDMSTGAFNALGTPDEGVFAISWKVV